MDALTHLRNYLGGRIDRLEARTPEVLYGVVTSVNPLKVRLSDGAELTNPPTLEAELEVSDQVRLLSHGGFQKGSRATVVGKVATVIVPRRIPAGADLNGYTTPGEYYSPLSADVAAMTNTPPGNLAGALEVLEAAGFIQYWHEFNTGPNGKVWRRRYYSGAWSSWEIAYAPPTAYAMAAGSFSGGQRTAIYTHTVTFPAGRFSVPPIVTATLDNAAGGSNQLQVVVGTVTASSALIIFLLSPGGSWGSGLWCTATWTAVQMTASSAGG